MAKDWGEQTRRRALATAEPERQEPPLVDRLLAAGLLTVQYEPLRVQGSTVASVLYPDRNRAVSWNL